MPLNVFDRVAHEPLPTVVNLTLHHLVVVPPTQMEVLILTPLW